MCGSIVRHALIALLTIFTEEFCHVCVYGHKIIFYLSSLSFLLHSVHIVNMVSLTLIIFFGELIFILKVSTYIFIDKFSFCSRLG